MNGACISPPPASPPPPPLLIGELADGTKCTSTEGIFSISFDRSSLAYSNLGGVGPDLHAPEGILITDVGSAPGVSRVDLRITNLTVYDEPRGSWDMGDVLHGRSNGTFGALALRSPTRGDTHDASIVELRFTFLNGATGQPLRIERTFISFCIWPRPLPRPLPRRYSAPLLRAAAPRRRR